MRFISNNLSLSREQAEELLVSPKAKIAVDIETVSLINTLPLGVAVAVSGDTGFYFFNVKDELLMKAITSAGTIITHNAAFDIPILRKLGCEVKDYEDTMLLAYSAGILEKSLGSLSETILHAPYVSVASQWVDRSKKLQEQGNVAIDHVLMGGWSIQHAINTFNLWEKLPMTPLYREIDRPCIDLVIEMEEWGILIDQYALTRVEQQEISKANPMKKELLGELHVTNLNSNPQVAEALRNLGIIGTRKTKSDKDSVSDESLRPLNLPLTNKLLKWKSMMKTLTTYIPAFRRVDDKGRLHTVFGYTNTGRWKSGDAQQGKSNMQNITRDERFEDFKEEDTDA